MAVNGVAYSPNMTYPAADAQRDVRDLEQSLPRNAAQDRTALQNERAEQERAREAIQAREERNAQAADREKLVLRPSEVSLEDRMKLVMSLEEVQRLLLIRAPYGPVGEPSIAQEAQGRLIDRLS